MIGEVEAPRFSNDEKAIHPALIVSGPLKVLLPESFSSASPDLVRPLLPGNRAEDGQRRKRENIRLDRAEVDGGPLMTLLPVESTAPLPMASVPRAAHAAARADEERIDRL
jgi:hypothetical protein